MIGISLPLCYPQIGSTNLLYLCASWPFMPLDKTYPTSGILRDLQAFISLRVYTRLKPNPRPVHLRVTQTVGRLVIGSEKEKELLKDKD
jgi:hypothetical protein